MQESPSDQQVLESGPKKAFYNKPWFIILAVIAGIALAAVLFVTFVLKFGSSGSAPQAKELFYTMVETAAQKDRVAYAYERTKPKVGQASGVHVKSLAEYEYSSKKYSTVFASEAIIAQIGRCVNGKEYINPDVRYPSDFAEAEEALRGKSQENTRTSTQACDYLKPRYEGNFTDGILPVGATAQQAKNMADELRFRDTIVLKDEGTATYEGKQGRKISFLLDPKTTNLPDKAGVFFYAFRDGRTGKVGGNGVDVDAIDAQFSMRLQHADGIKGFYLIDESTKLPIYSEIVTIGSEPDFSPDTALSTYEYPESFTIGPNTPLPNISKPE